MYVLSSLPSTVHRRGTQSHVSLGPVGDLLFRLLDESPADIPEEMCKGKKGRAASVFCSN